MNSQPHILAFCVLFGRRYKVYRHWKKSANSLAFTDETFALLNNEQIQP